MEIKEALERHEQQLMGVPGVTGIGIGERDGRPVVVVLLNRPASELRDKLPRTLNGFPVVLEEIGDPTAL
jgi:hypothetical protein